MLFFIHLLITREFPKEEITVIRHGKSFHEFLRRESLQRSKSAPLTLMGSRPDQIEAIIMKQ